MILAHATQMHVVYPVEQRQDRAKCLDCDWSFGWDLRFEMVERYASEHRETGHQLDYRIEFISRRETRYVIGGR